MSNREAEDRKDTLVQHERGGTVLKVRVQNGNSSQGLARSAMLILREGTMRALVRLRTLITTKLGACAFCIRASLLSSLASWAVFAAVSWLVPGSSAATLALLPAVGFTSLFASHLAAYVVRVVLAYRRAGRVAAGEPAASPADRRRFLVLAARTIGLALVPTVLGSALSGSVLGGPCDPQGSCNPSINGCCCDNAGKTHLPKCNPNYDSCSITCQAVRPATRSPRRTGPQSTPHFTVDRGASLAQKN